MISPRLMRNSAANAIKLPEWLLALSPGLLLVLSISASALMLTGCAQPIVRSTVPLIPANLLIQCKALESLDNGLAATVLQNIALNAITFHECADSKAALIEAIKKFHE